MEKLDDCFCQLIAWPESLLIIELRLTGCRQVEGEALFCGQRTIIMVRLQKFAVWISHLPCASKVHNKNLFKLEGEVPLKLKLNLDVKTMDKINKHSHLTWCFYFEVLLQSKLDLNCPSFCLQYLKSTPLYISNFL